MTTHTERSSTPDIGARRWVALVVICMAALLLSVDLTVLQLAIPSIIKDLEPTSNQILWIADIYGLALSGLLVTMGNIGDRIGRKKLLLIGSFAFAAASVLCAYAQNPDMLIASRALLGVAGATVYPTTLSIIRNIFTNPKERTTAVGIWTGMISGGMALGPMFAGPLLHYFWWGSVFLINVPVMIVLFTVGAIVIPESRNPKPGRIDVLSVLLSAISLIGIVYAIQESVHDGLHDPKIIGSAAVGVVALVVFAWRQTRLEEPLVDVRLFKIPAYAGSVAANTFALFAFIGVTLLLSQYFQLGHGWSPLKTGLAMLPPAGVAIILSPLVGAVLLPKLGRGATATIGLCIGALSMYLYSRVGVNTGYGFVIIPIILQAVGAISTFTVTSDTIINSAPKERSGAASAVATMAAELGGALGMAVMGTILNHHYAATVQVPDGLPAQAVGPAKDSLGGALEVVSALPAQAGRIGQQLADSAKSAFVGGMHIAVLMNVGILLVVAVVAAITLRGTPVAYPEDDEVTPEAETLEQPEAPVRTTV